jgi:hypothetical protein
MSVRIVFMSDGVVIMRGHHRVDREVLERGGVG